jgi:hypothetical protein
MPIYVEPIITTIDTGVPVVDDATVIRAGIPAMDDCKILTRLKAFIYPQSLCGSIEHVFRNAAGSPVDLSAYLGTNVSESASTSSSASASGSCVLAVRLWDGDGGCPIQEIAGEAIDATRGVIRFAVPARIAKKPGIYELTFGIRNSQKALVAVDKGLLSVERNLFGASGSSGPALMTIQELRMRMMDSSRNENLLLDDVEFKDEQILQAMLAPVRYWNEIPPPLRKHTTASFPYTEHWTIGTMAQLYITMAAHFRRNTLRGVPGGTSDKDKEIEYLREGTRLWQDYTLWAQNKKVAVNLRGFFGNTGSDYAGLN